MHLKAGWGPARCSLDDAPGLPHHLLRQYVCPRLYLAPRFSEVAVVKILYARVTPAFIAFLKPVLSSSGCDVIVASDGRDALDTFCAERVDLILVDMGVPVMSGLEVTGKIRVIEAMQELPWTPIVVLIS
jgi:PleD family two-component response regulator